MDNQPNSPTSQTPEAPMGANPKHNSKNISILVVGVLVIVGLLAFSTITLIHHYDKGNKTSSVSAVPIEASITPTGFTPATISINVGQVVVWTNYDTKPHSVSANPYPLDNSLEGFNSPPLSQNQTYSFVFDNAGTYYYHDNLNPFTYKGVIIVK